MLLSVIVDPSRDSAAVLANYASGLGADPVAWKFLRDSTEALTPVVGANHEWAKAMPNGELDHPARVHLIDADGRIREIYSLAFFDPRQALIDIRSVAVTRRLARTNDITSRPYGAPRASVSGNCQSPVNEYLLSLSHARLTRGLSG